MLKRLLAATAALCLTLGLAASSLAQSTFQTPQSATGGPSVPGVMQMCPNGSGLAVPCGSSSAAASTQLAPTSSTSGAKSHAATSGLASSLVVKAIAGNLYNVNCTAITGNAAGYCVVINATSAPTTGSAITPLDFCYAANTGGCSLTHADIPINYSTGIVVLLTTAASPYTFTSGVDTAAIGADYF